MQVESLKSLEELREALDLVILFAALVRGAATMTLKDWLLKAESAACVELRGFAKTLRQDEAAVQAGMALKWSNGPVEGHVNRLKFLKRQMFGRAALIC